jgi:hypothetical protein
MPKEPTAGLRLPPGSSYPLSGSFEPGHAYTTCPVPRGHGSAGRKAIASLTTVRSLGISAAKATEVAIRKMEREASIRSEDILVFTS